jgi:hypothetical protein
MKNNAKFNDDQPQTTNRVAPQVRPAPEYFFCRCLICDTRVSLLADRTVVELLPNGQPNLRAPHRCNVQHASAESNQA